MHHSGYYLVSLIFGNTIPTSFNILVKLFLHLYTGIQMPEYSASEVAVLDVWRELASHKRSITHHLWFPRLRHPVSYSRVCMHVTCVYSTFVSLLVGCVGLG